ncbi:MAG: hypothetical protein K9L02_05060 [Acholeplasmataceae bacterium]|nr:hypothetical protein [Acholeplasmataceae bacterium]
MKHIAFIFSLVVLISMMAIIITNNMEKVPKRLLSVQKYYSYLYEEDLEMKIPLYINDIDHPLAHASSYDVILLSNPDEHKMIQMELSKITYGYEEMYLNEKFYQMTLHLELPNLGEDFLIEDLVMKVTLINGDSYEISLGVLSLMSTYSNSDALEWSALEGRKNETLFISRLKTITIEYTTCLKEIDTIRIGIDFEVDFSVEQDQIVLTVFDQYILMDDVPIIIFYSDGSIQTIANFRYMFDYEILKDSGMLITPYALN